MYILPKKRLSGSGLSDLMSYGINSHSGIFTQTDFKCFDIIPYFSENCKPFYEIFSPFSQKIPVRVIFSASKASSVEFFSASIKSEGL